MRSRKHYIYVTSASLACYRESANGLELVANISTPRDVARDQDTLGQSIQQFGMHLDSYPHDTYYVITDTQAEAYQAETVPTLSRRDLRLLLTRKMEQRYRATHYRAVVPHRSRPYAFIRKLVRRRSRSTTRILYALISPEALAPWLAALEERAMNVRGLYSLGALMPALWATIKVPIHSDALFVMRTAAGYRHAFVSPSGLRFSRLCAYSNAGDAQVGQEIDKTLQYLTMTRLWGVQGRDRMLHITVIDAQPSANPISVPGSNLRTAQLTQVRPGELMRNAPQALVEGTNSAWLLFNPGALRAHGLGCAADLSLSDAGRRSNHRRAALGVTAAAALLSAGYLGVTEVAAREKIEQAATYELIAGHVNSSAAGSERTAPKAALEPEQLSAAVRTRDQLLGRNISALGLMKRTATALAPFPDLQVDVLQWSYSDPGAAAGAPSADAPPSGPAIAAPGTIVLRLSGHIGANSLKSDANAAVLQLAAALAKELHGKQSIEKLPFDTAASGTLTTNLKDGAAAGAEFSVAVAVPAALNHAS